MAEQRVGESRERATARLEPRDRIIASAEATAFLLVAIPLALLASTSRSQSLLLTGTLIGAYALASRVEFEIGSGSAIPTQLVFVPMLFLLPARVLPLAVAVGLVAGLLPDLVRRRLHVDQLILQPLNSLHALGPALVMLAAGEPFAALSRWPWPVLGGAVLAQAGCDLLAQAIRGRYALGIPLRELVRFMAPVYLVDLALTPVGLAFAIVSRDQPYAVLLALPLIGLLAYFARERQGRIDHALELGHAYRGTAFLLGDVVEADDAYTGGHSRDVVELVLEVCDQLGLAGRERRKAELTALLHDVGKIRIPNAIINKPGALTPEERAIIETHTIEGERLLARVGGLLGEVGRVVRSCHERWDGDGYPDGLAGEAIPRLARIVMCCDAFNAMTTHRSYRKALPLDEACAELRRCSGSQFDPEIVEALLRHVQSADSTQAARAVPLDETIVTDQVVLELAPALANASGASD
jgi:HD-GYP domain-containing protein (c-di-GMP phosphodiesterase class II)